MEILIYMIPGILAYHIYTMFYDQIPTESVLIKILPRYLALTLVSVIVIYLIGAICGVFDWGLSINGLSYTQLKGIRLYKVILILISSTLITAFIYWLYMKILSKTIGYELGATTYKELLEKVFIQKTTKITRPTRIYMNNKEISNGQFLKYYVLPWEFKELLLNNQKNFKFDELKLLYTYVDLEKNIKIEVYNHPTEEEKKNGSKEKE